MVVMPASIYGFGGDAAVRFNSMEDALSFAEGLREYLTSSVGGKKAGKFPVELIANIPGAAATLDTLVSKEQADDVYLLIPGGLFHMVEAYMESEK